MNVDRCKIVEYSTPTELSQMKAWVLVITLTISILCPQTPWTLRIMNYGREESQDQVDRLLRVLWWQGAGRWSEAGLSLYRYLSLWLLKHLQAKWFLKFRAHYQMMKRKHSMNLSRLLLASLSPKSIQKRSMSSLLIHLATPLMESLLLETSLTMNMMMWKVKF